ncbi:MAG: ParB/RepB/Spo0J family partition protein [Pseudomonadota bacterium]
MAKRRKITAPSAEDLNRIEEEFRRETLGKPNAGIAPISQVAAESAQAQPVGANEARVRMAHDMADAKRFRAAAEQGRVIEALPIDSIQPDVLVRDRTVIDPEEMAELKSSIADHGLRLPIEVFTRREGRRSYALLSGFRRLRAIKELHAETGEDRFRTIAALVRDPEALGGGFAAMVEENEIRASLSHFERGRIAVIAAQRGAFASTDAAVTQLFKAASKAKRSKIRSFSLIFEELGDLLTHAEGLKERDGLRLAAALRAGGVVRLRRALEDAQPESSEAEWAVLAPVVAALEKPANPAKGGRPRNTARVAVAEATLPGGVTLRGEKDAGGYLIRLQGKAVTPALLERAMTHLQEALAGDEEE